MRYLIDFSYSGANFNGYQKQPGKRTIQEEIERILTSINGGKEVTICSSGRTDAKVNALHQMAHFDMDKCVFPYKLKGALNSYLPSDIHVNSIKEVDDNFHARYMVKSKTYEYRINMGEYNPLFRNAVYQYCKELNIEKIKLGIRYFIGTHDFTTFTCSEDKRTNKIRTIYDVFLSIDGDILIITFKGNGFLKYQIRNMVGTLIKIGEDKIEPDIIEELLNKKDRRCAFLCAPPEGLTLINVVYD